MHISIIAIGNRNPAWVSEPCNDYLQRMPSEWRVRLIELPAEKRSKNLSLSVVKTRETVRLLEAVPRGNRIVVMDEHGAELSTRKLAAKLGQWQQSGEDISIVIGGADGIDFDVFKEPSKHGLKSLPKPVADWRWSLSQLTLPHLMVRIILVEQLYRAWSIQVGHPYHRE